MAGTRPLIRAMSLSDMSLRRLAPTLAGPGLGCLHNPDN